MKNSLFGRALDGVRIAGMVGPYQGRLVAEISAVEVRAARRVADGLEALQLVVAPGAIVGVVEWPESAGFAVLVYETGIHAGSRRIEIILQLADARFRDVFLALCEDVCSVLADASEESAAVHAFHSRLMRWQSFLKRHAPEGLSPEAQVGLFGELKVMVDVLMCGGQLAKVLRAWRGCKGAAQDFQFEGWALEVKTSRAAILERVSVSNVQQLDEDALVPLFLTVVHVQASPVAGETLVELVARVRERVGDVGREALDDGLMEVGYLDIHDTLYSGTKYGILEVLHHEVRDGFPRIQREQLPDGVKKVRYDISIDAARGFRVSESAVYTILERMQDGHQQ